MKNTSRLLAGDRILKPKDIQAIFQCSEYKAYKLFDQQDFPALKIGREYYIKESDLNEWFDTYKGSEYELL